MGESRTCHMSNQAGLGAWGVGVSPLRGEVCGDMIQWTNDRERHYQPLGAGARDRSIFEAQEYVQPNSMEVSSTSPSCSNRALFHIQHKTATNVGGSQGPRVAKRRESLEEETPAFKCPKGDDEDKGKFRDRLGQKHQELPTGRIYPTRKVSSFSEGVSPPLWTELQQEDPPQACRTWSGVETLDYATTPVPSPPHLPPHPLTLVTSLH